MASLRAVITALLVAGVATTALAVELYEGIYAPWLSLPSPFVQWGGTASVQRVGPLFDITLHNGAFHSGSIAVWFAHGYSSYFTQNGGRHLNTNGITLASSSQRYRSFRSSYMMNGGVLKAPYFVAGGAYHQTGGTTVVGQCDVPSPGSVTVEDGLLRTAALNVSGIHNFGFMGWTASISARYRQTGGTVTTGDILVSSGASALIEGGSLTASNLTVIGSMMDGYLGPGGHRPVYALFEQRGGEIVLARRLNVETTFNLESGALTAPVISVVGCFTAKSSDIVNAQSFILRGGKFEAYASCQLGPLVLRTNGLSQTISELSFHDPATVRFRGSSEVWWSPGAYLIVKGWRGSTDGGGESRLQVGHTAAGLTREQLRRIIFENPANLPLGDYSARIVSTGEVVPNKPIQIHLARHVDGITVAWREPYYLQTTTNLANPSHWVTLTQASPFAINFTEPHRFFRLQHY